MGRTSCGDHPAFPWQTAAAQAFPWQHAAAQMIRWPKNKPATLQRAILNSTGPFLYRIICINKPVSVSSAGFCSWPRCLQHFKIKRTPLLSLVLLLAVRVWHETSTRGLRGHRHTEQKLRTKGTVLSVTQVKRLTLKGVCTLTELLPVLLCNLNSHVPFCLLLALHAGRPQRSVSLQSLL